MNNGHIYNVKTQIQQAILLEAPQLRCLSQFWNLLFVGTNRVPEQYRMPLFCDCDCVQPIRAGLFMKLGEEWF